jgi:hypothetical protein
MPRPGAPGAAAAGWPRAWPTARPRTPRPRRTLQRAPGRRRGRRGRVVRCGRCRVRARAVGVKRTVVGRIRRAVGPRPPAGRALSEDGREAVMPPIAWIEVELCELRGRAAHRSDRGKWEPTAARSYRTRRMKGPANTRAVKLRCVMARFCPQVRLSVKPHERLSGRHCLGKSRSSRSRDVGAGAAKHVSLYA